MRTPLLLPALGALLLVTGCYGGGEAESVLQDVVPTEGPVTEHTYAPDEQITVDLTMHGGDDGGRTTPFLSGYQPTIEFEHQEQTAECTAQLPVELQEFPPGESHAIGLRCGTEVTVHADAPGFRLLEGGTEYGTGEVVLTGGAPDGAPAEGE